ncbi:MAG: bifunctional phosphoribosylaminoimidazolecarboxamide formyltransferase/IMP cyclohydrolase [Candidatus Sumerlaeaceae bacterium]|nr:bifunctional phosphoribosylaminoimidazolecarboxamide formyltransferase/IMP cyclohydrolase [Candidatus Sumerlaeaceae bacterium]
MTTHKTALISVFDKTGIEEFAQFLVDRGYEILSTGGTLKRLAECGIPATSISDYTGQEEILGGRVKTLHPKIFAGILARRSNSGDMATLVVNDIKPIDIVVVNLYPFQKTIAQHNVTLGEAIEQMDIGGVALLRAAAKNFTDVTVASRTGHLQQIQDTLGSDAADRVSLARLRADLARDAFAETSAYDRAIASYLASEFGGKAEFPDHFTADFHKLQDLRYGENPHQQAAFYGDRSREETSVARARQLHGKELSYNNIIDLDSALEVVRAFEEPTCCIIKHNNPCGVARGETLVEAYKAARDCDPVSAFGGVIGLNREVDVQTAEEVAEMFVEAVIATSYAQPALEILEKKKNIRLLETGSFTPAANQDMLKSVVGGLLVQTRDRGLINRDQLKVVSKLQPTDEDIDALLFAWRVAKFVKSNAIVYTSANATIGIGAGQMSRIDSTSIAAVKARSPIRGAYMASDAFFPFRDNVDRAADIGIKAIISPGGSVRDGEVISAADEHGIIMVFTGMRHFRH